MKKILLTSFLLTMFLAACAPAATPTPAPTANASAVSQAVVAVDMFYTFINVAQTQDDLGLPWGMLTNEAQCNAIDKCEMSAFQGRWWESKIIYRLYGCGANTVLVEGMLYPRTDDAPAKMTDPDYWTYKLSDTGGVLLISKISSSNAPGADCVLALDRTLNP